MLKGKYIEQRLYRLEAYPTLEAYDKRQSNGEVEVLYECAEPIAMRIPHAGDPEIKGTLPGTILKAASSTGPQGLLEIVWYSLYADKVFRLERILED